MLFSELEEVLEDLSRNKQRLTVSRHAYNILLQDDEIFEPDKKQNRSGGDPSSTLVNQLFQNLYETAESSIWMRLGAEKEKLAEYFHGQENAEACTVAVLALLAPGPTSRRLPGRRAGCGPRVPSASPRASPRPVPRRGGAPMATRSGGR